jgi:hypothetical protein
MAYGSGLHFLLKKNIHWNTYETSELKKDLEVNF